MPAKSLHVLALTVAVFSLALSAPAWALDDVNPGGGYSGSFDWDGTANNDNYTNNGSITFGSIDMTQGGTDKVVNSGTVDFNIVMGATDGNTVENSGSFGGNITGSYNEVSGSTGGSNTIVNKSSGVVHNSLLKNCRFNSA